MVAPVQGIPRVYYEWNFTEWTLPSSIRAGLQGKFRSVAQEDLKVAILLPQAPEYQSYSRLPLSSLIWFGVWIFILFLFLADQGATRPTLRL